MGCMRVGQGQVEFNGSRLRIRGRTRSSIGRAVATVVLHESRTSSVACQLDKE